MRRFLLIRLMVGVVLLSTVGSTAARAQSPSLLADSGGSGASAQKRDPYELLSPDDKKLLVDGPIPDANYVIGGLVGTFVGLGIGQAIEGRYMSTGLIITIGEIVTAGMWIGGAIGCVSDAAGSFAGTTNNGGACSVAVIGVLGYIGFRVFEIVDVWVSPPSINRRYRRLKKRFDNQDDGEDGSTMTVIPAVAKNTGSPDGATLLFQYRF